MDYHASLAERQYRDSRFLVMLGVIVMIASLPVAWLIMPDHLGEIALMLAVSVLPLQLLALALPRRRLRLLKLAMALSIIAFACVLFFCAQWAPPLTGAFFAMGPVVVMGMSTPILPLKPRETLAFLIVFASGLASIVVSTDAVVMHDLGYFAITAMVLVVSFTVRMRVWNLQAHSFLLSLQLEQRLAELSTSNNRLTELSTRDPLTALANRRHFQDMFERHFSESPVHGEARVSLFMIDLDHFKEFNDNWGHLTGDDCLCATGEILRHYSDSNSGIAARYGGEEFVMVTRVADWRRAESLAEEVRVAIERIEISHRAKNSVATCTASIGVTLHAADEAPKLKLLMAEADRALYRAKEEGRNKVVVANTIETRHR